MDRRRSSRDSQPSSHGLRRSSTAPLGSPAASTSFGPGVAIATDPDGTVETLFNHPSARIIVFTNHDTTGRYRPETLAPGGRVDRTLAAGPLRIYKAPGSVTFLNCGSALKPILPKSQCWCIKEDSSKFILQIRAPQFWRIEIPVETPEQHTLAAEFRQVLDTILLFDKTPCPFQRSFTVELPDVQEVKKRPWKPVPKPVDTLVGQIDKANLSPARKLPKSGASISNGPDIARGGVRTPGSSKGGSRTGSGHSTPPIAPGSNRVGEVARLARAFNTQEEISNKLSGHRRQPSSTSKSGSSARRSSRVTNVPPLGLSTPDRSKSRTSMYSDSGPTSPTLSTAGSDSIYSGDWHCSSPPFSGFSSPISGPMYDDDDDSICAVELDDTAPPSASKGKSKYPPSASKSGHVKGSEGATKTGTSGTSTASGHRRRRSSLNQAGLRRPNLASLPPAANLLSQRRQPSSGTAQSKKEEAEPLEPTNYLAKLMLRVAARITTGEWRGVVFGVNEAGEKIPVQWDYTDGVDSEDEHEGVKEKAKLNVRDDDLD